MQKSLLEINDSNSNSKNFVSMFFNKLYAACMYHFKNRTVVNIIELYKKHQKNEKFNINDPEFLDILNEATSDSVMGVVNSSLIDEGKVGNVVFSTAYNHIPLDMGIAEGRAQVRDQLALVTLAIVARFNSQSRETHGYALGAIKLISGEVKHVHVECDPKSGGFSFEVQ